VLRSDTGELLTENPVVLQYVADRSAEAGLAPQGGMERYRLQQWLSFVTSELHKLVFNPLLDPKGTGGAKAYARDKAGQRLAHLNGHLAGRDYLLDRFTVADAYLVTVLNWTQATDIDLAKWPAVQAYHRGIQAAQRRQGLRGRAGPLQGGAGPAPLARGSVLASKKRPPADPVCQKSRKVGL
jgi:glutathione S-transferase